MSVFLNTKTISFIIFVRKNGMNYLAHLYLSGNDEELLVGNYIADGLKGADKSIYNERILEGIKLHRKIDDFTDTHDVFVKSAQRLKPKYGLYGWVLVDIFYDHILAKNWNQYHHEPLNNFALHVYQLLEKRKEQLPKHSQRFLWYMQQYHILFHYANYEGIEKVLLGMSKRTRFDSGMERAIVDLKNDIHLYEEDFAQFFPDLVTFVNSELQRVG
jgi:acyl carrier protein phosphodiesterase